MGNDVYLDGRGGAVYNRFTYYPLLIKGQVYAEKIALDDFKPAIKGYKNCFAVEYAEGYVIGYAEPQQVPSAKLLCDDKALGDYRSASLTADKLAALSLRE